MSMSDLQAILERLPEAEKQAADLQGMVKKTMMLTAQSNLMLRRICEKQKIEIPEIPVEAEK